MLRVGADVLRDLAASSRREWVLADGQGGYAASTVVGLNTRRHHGLLVCPARSPLLRMVYLSRVEEALVVEEARHELGTNDYAGVVHPRGFLAADTFLLDPLPTLTWEVEGHRLSRTVARLHDVPAVVLAYEHEGPDPVTLEVRPLVAYRPAGGLQHENGFVRGESTVAGPDVVLRPFEGCPPLLLRFAGAEWAGDGVWYRGFVYERDAEEGTAEPEDLFSHGFFRITLRPGAAAHLVAWAGPAMPGALDASARVAAERKRRRAVGDSGEGFVPELRRAADAFVVRRPDGVPAILSGYPAGGIFGRDVLLALPGVLLAPGRHDEARALLGELAARIDGGRMPGRWPEEGGPPAFDDPEVALWWILALSRFLEATGDRQFVKTRAQGAVVAILEACRSGASGLVMSADGLVSAPSASAPGTDGGPEHGLAWVSAADPAGRPRTFPIELQALWYNALLAGADLAKGAGQTARAGEWSAVAARVRESVARLFWSEGHGFLADSVDESGGADFALRGRQLYALGLPHVLLPRDRAQRVLEAVRRSLLTPVGVRALAPAEPSYTGGGADRPLPRALWTRGAAWPHLAVLYFDALIRVHGEAAKAEAWRWLDGLAPRIEDAGLGTLAEAYEGDAPHRPLGAVASAASVAEVLRLALRLGRRPASRVRPSA